MTKRRSITSISIGLAGSVAMCAQLSPALAQSSKAVGPQKCDVSMTVEDLLKVHPPKANKKYKIAVEEATLAGYWFQAYAYGAEKAALEAGAEITLDAGKGFLNQAQQLTNVENALSRGVDGILINPVDQKGAVAAVDAAEAKKVVIVASGTLVDSPKAFNIVQDDFVQGKVTAEFLAKLLPNGGEGIVMGGPANATWSAHRVLGLQNELKAHPTIKISTVTHQDVNPAEGLVKFTNAAQAHPKVDWIYSTYNLLLPASSIPPNYSKAAYLTSGYEPDTVIALKNGSLSAVVPVFPIWMGYVGMTYVIKKLNGEEIPATTCLPNMVASKDDIGKPGIEAGNIYPADWKPPVR
jgi:ribose transport system substrate-binding protein